MICDPDYSPEDDIEYERDDYIELGYCLKVDECIEQNPTHTMATIKKNFRKVKDRKHLNRIKKYADQAGISSEKFILIAKYTWHCHDARLRLKYTNLY